MKSDKASTSRPNANANEDRNTKGSKKKTKVLMVSSVVLTLVIAVAAVWGVWNYMANAVSGVDANKYQAVFFTNGQVYFGKLHPQNSEYMKLTDIFYLQTNAKNSDDSKNPQKTVNTQDQDVQLIKLGEEVHGPEDVMIISKSQVLFFENLKSDGKVASTIEQYISDSKK